MFDPTKTMPRWDTRVNTALWRGGYLSTALVAAKQAIREDRLIAKYAVESNYRRYRKLGYSASVALRNAKIVERFEQLESDGVVRVCYDGERESYFDVHGDPDPYTDRHGRRWAADQAKAEIARLIDLYGCLCVYTEVLFDEDEDDWERADSVGMVIQDKPMSAFDNPSVPDIMLAAIHRFEETRDAEEE